MSWYVLSILLTTKFIRINRVHSNVQLNQVGSSTGGFSKGLGFGNPQVSDTHSP